MPRVIERPRDVGVVIPAAGSGRRFGGKKTFRQLAGRPLLDHALRVFASLREVVEVVVAVQRQDLPGVGRKLARIAAAIRRRAPGRALPVLSAVEGGKRRQDSVERGLEALSPAVRWVLVHDAARPLVRREDIRSLIAAVRKHGAAALGHLATDSVKLGRAGLVARDLPRDSVWLVQTPQGAATDLLRRAYARARRSGREFTDEAGLLKAMGARVRLVPGDRRNIKITFAQDLDLARFYLRQLGREPA